MSSKAFAAVPSAPTLNSAIAGTSQVSLSWSTVSGATGYSVKYGTASGSYTVTKSAGTATAYTVTGLTNGTTYYFVVVASNTSGTSPNSNERAAQPIAAPTLNTATAGDTKVSLGWSSVNGATSYSVKYGTKSGVYTITINVGNVTSHTVAGLTNGTTYYFVVVAHNATGTSKNSNQKSARPVPPPPAPVLNTAVSGTSKVSLSWSASATATGYTVKYGTASGSYKVSKAVGKVTSYTLTGLYNGTAYYFVVIASNLGGNSPNSNEKSAKPIAAPILSSATAGNAQVTLGWNAVPGAIGYTIKYGTASGSYSSTVEAGSVTSFKVTGLINGMTYYFVVVANNATGTSNNSTEKSAKPLGPPPAPVLDSAVAGESEVSLSWKAAFGATGYTVKYGTTSGVYTTTVPLGNVTSHTVSGLTNGIMYYFVVAASNSYGTGPDSNEKSAVPVSPLDTTAPSVPADLAATAVSSTQIDLTWSSSTDNVGVTGYRIFRDGTPVATSVSTSFSDAGLMPDTTYSYQVSAFDAAGNESAPCPAVSATTQLTYTPIVYGQTVTATISTPAEIVKYSFVAQAGDKVMMAGRRITGGAFDPYVQLRDVNGNVIGNAVRLYDLGTFTATIQTAGTYYFWIHDGSYDTAGTYQVTLERLNDPVGVTTMTWGQIVNGTTTFITAQDVYGFATEQGDRIVISFQNASGGSFDPIAILRDTNGIPVGNSVYNNGTITATSSSNGTYYLWIYDGSYDSTGSYTITLVDNLVVNVSVSPMFINPAINETATLQFSLERNSQTVINLYQATLDASNVLQKTLIQTLFSGPLPKGQNTYTCNGKDVSQVILPQDSYVFTIEATEITGTRHSLYNPAYVPGSVQIQTPVLNSPSFDPYKGETTTLSYNLVAPAWVTLRAGVSGVTTASRTLFLNKPRDIVNNSDVWDGRDNNGNILAAGTYVIYGWANLLPSHAVVIRNTDPPRVDALRADPYAFLPAYSESANIEYGISEDSTVTLVIKNSAGTVIRTLVDNEAKSAGVHTVVWDGRDSSGDAVPAGDYKLTLTTVTQDGSNVIRDGNVRVFK